MKSLEPDETSATDHATCPKKAILDYVAKNPVAAILQALAVGFAAEPLNKGKSVQFQAKTG